jgi:ribosomal protein L40E
VLKHMQQKDFEIISIIASRKTELYINARNKLLASLPSDVDRTEAALRLRRAIAELDNVLFISEGEKRSNTIKAGLSVAQLSLDTQAISNSVVRAMTGRNRRGVPFRQHVNATTKSCSKCGAENAASNEFCTNCGNKFQR